MHFEITPANTLVAAITGSHVYGTDTPTSDLDIRGVVLTPLWLKLSTTHSFEQHIGDVPVLRTHVAPRDQPWQDCTIYDVVKAAHLIAQCNPNMVELLWNPFAYLLGVRVAANDVRPGVIQIEKDAVACALTCIGNWIVKAGRMCDLGPEILKMARREIPIPGGKGWSAMTKQQEEEQAR